MLLKLWNSVLLSWLTHVVCNSIDQASEPVPSRHLQLAPAMAETTDLSAPTRTVSRPVSEALLNEKVSILSPTAHCEPILGAATNLR
jgi:hypothetical protein